MGLVGSMPSVVMRSLRAKASARHMMAKDQCRRTRPERFSLTLRLPEAQEVWRDLTWR